jgi:hypothetical protein
MRRSGIWRRAMGYHITVYLRAFENERRGASVYPLRNISCVQKKQLRMNANIYKITFNIKSFVIKPVTFYSKIQLNCRNGFSLRREVTPHEPNNWVKTTLN